MDECEEDEDAADDAEKADDNDAAYPLLDNLILSAAFSETENGKRKTEHGLLIRQLQKLLPDLDLMLADLPRIENIPKNQRKNSEKSAPKTPCCTNKTKQYHKDPPSEKKLPKNPSIGPDPKGGASQNGVHPAVLEGEAHPAIPENEVYSAVPDFASPPEVLDEPLRGINRLPQTLSPIRPPAPKRCAECRTRN